MEKDFAFEEPWEPTHRSDFLQEQIEAELTPPHPLYRKVEKALAIRADSDDVLVKTTEGYALVHLSWCRRSRPSPDFPHALLLESWQAFLDRVYQPDVAAWQEENPITDWEAMLKEASESDSGHP